MKTFLNLLTAVLVLNSTFLTAQSVSQRELYDKAAKAEAFLEKIEKFDSSTQLRNSARALDSTYVFQRTDDGNLDHVARITYEFDELDRIKTVRQFEI